MVKDDESPAEISGLVDVKSLAGRLVWKGLSWLVLEERRLVREGVSFPLKPTHQIKPS
jgi:hypothetical protein